MISDANNGYNSGYPINYSTLIKAATLGFGMVSSIWQPNIDNTTTSFKPDNPEIKHISTDTNRTITMTEPTFVTQDQFRSTITELKSDFRHEQDISVSGTNKSIEQLSGKIDLMANTISTQIETLSRSLNDSIISINTRIDDVNKRIDTQNTKIDGFATKNTIYVTGAILGLIIVGAFYYLSIISPEKLTTLLNLLRPAIKDIITEILKNYHIIK